MKALLLAALLISASAHAHVEPGTYKGVKADGSACQLLAGKGYFDRDTPHPLNERIPVVVDGESFTVGHPPVIDSRDSTVFFNHDLFQGLLPTASGADAVEINMEHSPEFEGPRSFVMMKHNWKTKEKTSYTCNEIKLSR